MSVKITSNLDKFLEDPLAYAEQFPCPTCQTVSKKVSEKVFYCPKCNVNFEIKPNYVSGEEEEKIEPEQEKIS